MYLVAIKHCRMLFVTFSIPILFSLSSFKDTVTHPTPLAVPLLFCLGFSFFPVLLLEFSLRQVEK